MAIGDNVNETIDRRREQRDQTEQLVNRQVTDATNLIATSCQQPLQIMAALFHAWGRGLYGMSEGFEDVRNQQERQAQQHQRGKTG